MATKSETIDLYAFLFAPAGVTAKKMFGEYALYCEGKLFALVCDDTLFVKITPWSEKTLVNAEKLPPYDGAKPMFAVREKDSAFLCALAKAVSAELPESKRKKR
ncbi:MAG: competence protein TfoX [Bacillota bacterium]|nr:MAG: competence protein TfoX [Bacillota bacterium]